MNGSIDKSFATGDANGGGGLVAVNHGAITQSYATGDVSGGYAGGLAGYNDGVIALSFATGDVGVQLTYNSTGGIVGHGSAGYALDPELGEARQDAIARGLRDRER